MLFQSSRRRRHKKLTDWGRQLLLQPARWLPDRQIIGVADSSYAAIDLLNAVRARVCMITRLRLDARLFDPPARRRPGTVQPSRTPDQSEDSLATHRGDRLVWIMATIHAKSSHIVADGNALLS